MNATALPQAIAVAILAGLGTAVMSGLLTPGVAPLVVLSMIAPAPLFIAGFGWHPLVAALGGIVAALIAQFISGSPAAILIAGMFALPAFALTALANRLFVPLSGRPERDGPELGRMAMLLILYVAIVGVIALLVILPDFSVLEARVRRTMDIVAAMAMPNFSQMPGAQQAEIRRWLDLIAGIMLPLSALLTIITIISGGLLGLTIADRSGRLGFVRPDLRRFRLPGGALILIGLAFLAASRPGYVGLMGEIVAFGLVLAFLLQGLAVVHVRSIGMTGRALVLGAAWAVVLVFQFLAPVFVVLGMADHLFDFRRNRL